MATTEAVLLMGFNRPDLLEQVIDAVRTAAPSRVYLAIDGPRPDRPGEGERVAACQALAARIDWPAQVHTLFQSANLGCGLGVSTAITWFFSHEERGIILEDDIVPDPSFFPYCTTLLDRYAKDERVFAISGCNFVPPSELSDPAAPYRFSQVPHIWGWATWRRSWAQHRLDIAGWQRDLPPLELWRRSGHSITGAAYWASTFELLARKEVDTWDGQLVLATMVSGQLTATSNVNLIRNIGFGGDATHTLEDRNELQPITPMTLPMRDVPVALDRRADAWTRRHHFRATLAGMVGQALRYLGRRGGRS